MAIGLVWSKVVALATMFSVTMAFGTIVYFIVRFLKRRGKNTANLGDSVMVSLLNCFAGGLFLGTFLLGLLPEVRHLFDEILRRYNIDTHFPVAEATTAVGFFLVMFLEHVVEMCQHRSHGESCDHSHGVGHSPVGNSRLAKGHINHSTDMPDAKESTFGTFHYANGRFATESVDDGRVSRSHEPVGVEGTSHLFMNDLNFKLGERNLVYNVESDTNINRDSEHVAQHTGTLQDTNREVIAQGRSQKADNMVLGSRMEPLGEMVMSDNITEDPSHMKKSFLRVFILVMALSLHTLFEGLALGLQDTESVIWTLLIAVSVHKAVIVTALSIELSKDEYNSVKRIFLSLFVFAIMSPIGVGVGTAITETGAPNDLATDTAAGILQGLAAGTFLYVTFFEVLNRELANGYDLRKVFSVMIGFSAIIGLRFLEHSSAH